MLDPRIEVVLRVASGAWWGLTLGLLYPRWDTRLAVMAAIYGVFVALFSWRSLPAPSRSIKRRWRPLDGAQRRAIATAIAHGRPVADPSLAPVAAEVAAAVLVDRRSARRRRLVALWLVVICATVVAAGLAGAPPAWVAAGAAFALAISALNVYLHSGASQRRIAAAGARPAVAA